MAIAFGDKHPLLQLCTHYYFAYTLWWQCRTQEGRVCPRYVHFDAAALEEFPHRSVLVAFMSNSWEIKISMQVRNGLSRKYHTFFR